MSKMDELRALREARYQDEAARGRPASAAPVRTPRPAAPGPATTGEPAVGGALLCGHRSMNGRSCTREQGHATKSHRYS